MELTVYGIETYYWKSWSNIHWDVATVPIVYGIETIRFWYLVHYHFWVAAAPTVYGIETSHVLMAHEPFLLSCNRTYCSRYWNASEIWVAKPQYSLLGCNRAYRLRYAQKGALQQRNKAPMRSALLLPAQSEGKTKVRWKWDLPFTVLKQFCVHTMLSELTRFQQHLLFTVLKPTCNAIYYKFVLKLQQYLPFTVLKLTW